MATLPTYQPPKYRELPGYNAPVYSDAEVDNLTQKRAAPGLRALRQTISRVGVASSGNSDVKRMTLRDALQGYGTGISKVIGESSEAAANEYGKKYGYQITNAQSAHAAAAAAANAYNEYAGDTAKTQFAGAMKGYETESESEQLSKKYELEGGLLEKKYALEDKYDEWEKKLEKEFELRDKYDRDNDWRERMDKEYDLWKQRYDYTRSNDTAPAPPPTPAVPFRWTPLGRA